MKIAFFLGSVDISGGSYVVYQHASYLQAAGHDVTVVVLYPYQNSQMTWHPATAALRFVPLNQLGEERFDLAVATWWKTATEIHKINARRYAYFVQSIESRFYPEAEAPLRALVDSTYDLPLCYVTEAGWIQSHLQHQHAQHPALVRNGIRKDLYNVHGEAARKRLPSGKLRVLVEGPFGVFFKNVGKSLKIARHTHADETWLLTSSSLNWYPRVDQVFSRIPINEVARVYRSCDVIVKLSYVEGMFGPPLEMFHCGGTAVVYDVTGHDEYIVDRNNALVLKRDDDEGVRRTINELRDDAPLLARLKEGAMKTASQWPDWTISSSRFDAVLTKFAEGPAMTRAELKERNESSMATYVTSETDRLRTTPKPSRFWPRVHAAMDAVPYLAHIRRISGFIREGY
jgi:hypothetical protein